ncbi:cold shock domain-containing protein [Sphingomonas flavescens]|uniref:cold shock domain-containing protein n=1 Tax=Sphingomonas flavescens TaxID=3132797 RepID=UPI002803B5AD|nr:cold shock domain-containing protein [Sphingomonas limnosediminicola]
MVKSVCAGQLSWFNREKRFGFVKLADRLGDAFLHRDALQAAGFEALPRGTTLQVLITPDRGKHRVVEILHVDVSTARIGEPLASPLPPAEKSEVAVVAEERPT